MMTTVSFGTSYRLALAGLGALVAAAPLAAQDPASIDLVGVVRDFTRDHPDFNVIPADGYAYYFGNVAIDLDEQGRPAFTGEGFKAEALWMTWDRHPIAPHLFNTCGLLTPGSDDPPGEPGRSSFLLTVDERLKMSDGSRVDSFDSNEGPYSDENSGSAAVVRANGNGDDSRYVRLKKRSKIMGDVFVGPDDDPDRVVRTKRSSEITGTVGNLEAMVEIPAVEMPAPLSAEAAGRVRHKGGRHSVTGDLRCEKFDLDRGAVMTVSGDVTIEVEEKFSMDDDAVLNVDGDVTVVCEKFDMDDGSEVVLAEGASLTLYVSEKLTLDDRSKLNMNTGNPQLVTVLLAAAGDGDDDDDDDEETRVKLDDGSQAAAWIHGANTRLTLDDGSELFGSFMGRRARLDDDSMMHVDLATGEAAGADDGQDVVAAQEPCDLGDIPGAAGIPSVQDVTSAGTFEEWWRDVLGVNMSGTHTITLTPDSTGTYQFIANDFRPIDGLLLGNEGDVHNYHFTYELDATFVHEAGTGGFFEFRGTDDAFVFINGKLVLDLGGYGYNRVQYVDIDRLGLPDGEPARLQFFHAQRQRGLGIFWIRTNLVLADAGGGTPSVNSVLDD